MRVPVSQAMHTSRSEVKKARRIDAKAKAERIANANKPKVASTKDASKREPAPVAAPPAAESKREFEKVAHSRRVNDVVQAPPTFLKLPRGVMKGGIVRVGKTKKTDGVVSMAQRQMMEVEREKAIQKYREMKEMRMAGKVI